MGDVWDEAATIAAEPSKDVWDHAETEIQKDNTSVLNDVIDQSPVFKKLYNTDNTEIRFANEERNAANQKMGGGGGIEFWSQDEPGQTGFEHPNGQKTNTLEIFSPELKSDTNALKKAVYGDLLHGLVKDPQWAEARKEFSQNFTPQVLSMLKRENRPLNDSTTDAWIRGYISPDKNNEFKKAYEAGEATYSPKQIEILGKMQNYLSTGKFESQSSDAAAGDVWDQAEVLAAPHQPTELITPTKQYPATWEQGQANQVDTPLQARSAMVDIQTENLNARTNEMAQANLKKVMERHFPFANAPEAYKTGTDTGDQIGGVTGKIVGPVLGAINAAGTAFNPLTGGARAIPQEGQALAEQATGNLNEAQASASGDRPFLPNLKPAMTESTAANMASDLAVGAAQDPINTALMVEGGVSGMKSLSAIKGLRENLQHVGGGEAKFTETPSQIARRTEQTFQDNLKEKGPDYLEQVIKTKEESHGSQYKGMKTEKLQGQLDKLSNDLSEYRQGNYGGGITSVDVDISSRIKAVATELKSRGVNVTLSGLEPEVPPTPEAAAEAPQTPKGNLATTSESPSPAPEAEPVDVSEPPAPPPGLAIPGAATVVKGAKGTEFPSMYVALPRTSVQASHEGENFAANPNFPLTNPRDYSSPEEQAKVIDVRNNFDPREHLTDSPNSAVGPAMIAEVIGEDGTSRQIVLGGNNRKQAIDLLSPEKQKELHEATNSKAKQFGFKKLPAGYDVYRSLGKFDLRQSGTRENLQAIMDALNPSPGLVQSAAKMAEVDAESSVAPHVLQGMTTEIAPKDAQAFVAGLISANLIDRNLRTSIMQSPSAAQDYVQRLIIHSAFKSPTITEFRQDARSSTAFSTARGMVDAAAPVLIQMRIAGRDTLANAVTQTFETILDYLRKGGKAAKIQNAIDLASRQLELGPESPTVREIAEGIKRQVVEAKGRIDTEATIEKFKSYFQTIDSALQKFDPTPDIFGNADTMEAAVKRGIEFSKKQQQVPAPKEAPSISSEGGGRRAVKTEPVAPAKLDPEYDPVTQGDGLKIFNNKTGLYADVPLAHMDKVRILQMPELVHLVKQLTGKEIRFKKLSKALGHFNSGTEAITLDPRIFKNPVAAAKTLGHEIGHLVDFLPDKVMKRGNLIGRLMTLRNFLKKEFGPGQVKNKDIREELKKLTQYWKPFDETKVSPHYKDYRYSSVELYADAVSVLFNSPGTLAKIAPKFYKTFFQYLDSKADVKAEFFELMELLNKGAVEVLKKRQTDIHAMFAKAEEAFAAKMQERELLHNQFRGWTQKLRQQTLDVFDPIIQKQRALEAAGQQVPINERVDFLFCEHTLSDNKVYRFLQQMWKNVVTPLESASFTTDDLGEYLFLKRILNENYEVNNKLAPRSAPEVGGRSVIPNPLGITPEEARLQLLRMRLAHGIKRMTLLDAAANYFHDMVFEVVGDATDAGIINRDTFENLIKPNKSNYATFVPIEYVDVFVPAGISKQVGTFKEIQNPFISTVLKTITMFRATQYQLAKTGAINFLKEYFGDEIQKAEEVFDGKQTIIRPPKDRSKTLLKIKENGKMAGYYVDPFIADMFENVTPASAHALMGTIDWTFRNVFYPMFIRFNPFFQMFSSPLKDFQRTFTNSPNHVGAWKLAVEYLKAIGPARARLKSQGNPIITEMIENFAIGTPYDSFARNLERRDTFEAILQKFSLVPEAEKSRFLNNILVKPIMGVLHGIEYVGQIFETLPKVATYKILTKDLGVPPREAAAYVRNHAGVPNFMRQGKFTRMHSTLFPFIQVFINGYRDDALLALKGVKTSGKAGKTPGSWWFKWALAGGGLAMVSTMAELGFFGEDLKRMYRGISEHDKSNYRSIPVGEQTGGDFGQKTVYFRIPQDETHRLMNAVMRATMVMGVKGVNGDLNAYEAKAGLQQIFAFGAGQVPGLTPPIKIGDAWLSYIEGQNPIDAFHGKTILNNSQYLAGGWEGMKPMLAWSYNQTGMANFVSVNPQADTTLELGLQNTPLLSRILKISDYGFREEQRNHETAEDRQRAVIKLSLPENVQSLLTEYSYLRGLGVEDRMKNLPQAERYEQLSTWYSAIYKPYDDIITATQEGQGASATKSFKEDLGRVSKPFERQAR
jgi:hypothetical protein